MQEGFCEVQDVPHRQESRHRQRCTGATHVSQAVQLSMCVWVLSMSVSVPAAAPVTRAGLVWGGSFGWSWTAFHYQESWRVVLQVCCSKALAGRLVGSSDLITRTGPGSVVLVRCVARAAKMSFVRERYRLWLPCSVVGRCVCVCVCCAPYGPRIFGQSKGLPPPVCLLFLGACAACSGVHTQMLPVAQVSVFFLFFFFPRQAGRYDLGCLYRAWCQLRGIFSQRQTQTCVSLQRGVSNRQHCCCVCGMAQCARRRLRTACHDSVCTFEGPVFCCCCGGGTFAPLP